MSRYKRFGVQCLACGYHCAVYSVQCPLCSMLGIAQFLQCVVVIDVVCSGDSVQCTVVTVNSVHWLPFLVGRCLNIQCAVITVCTIQVLQYTVCSAQVLQYILCSGYSV